MSNTLSSTRSKGRVFLPVRGHRQRVISLTNHQHHHSEQFTVTCSGPSVCTYQGEIATSALPPGDFLAFTAFRPK